MSSKDSVKFLVVLLLGAAIFAYGSSYLAASSSSGESWCDKRVLEELDEYAPRRWGCDLHKKSQNSKTKTD